MAARYALVAAALAAALALFACGGSDDTAETGETATPTPTTSAVALPDVAELRGAANELVTAIMESDGERIRALVSERARDQVRDSENQALANCIREDQEVRITISGVSLSGDEASVHVAWRVTEGERSDVGDRTWQYERQGDGSWALSALPECPVAAQE